MLVNNMTDEELIFFLTLNSNKAKDLLINKYQVESERLINCYTFKIVRDVIGKDALKGVCLSSFMNAIKNVEIGKQKFKPYWKKIVFNDIRDYVNREVKQYKNRVSLNGSSNKSETEYRLEEVVGKPDSKQQFLIMLNEIEKQIKDEGFDMDFDEKKIFQSYLDGYKHNEIIAMYPNYSKSKIYRVISRGKQLIKRRVFIR